MTREEAIKHLLHDWHINLGCEFAIKPGRLDDFLAAVDVALTALRPVSRERVEKVWRGEWVALDECSNEGVYCERCKKKVYRIEYANEKMRSPFCPHCGAAQTDEAVQMVMERWKEALKDAGD